MFLMKKLSNSHIMCYNPKRVRNPKIDYDFTKDKAFLYVPCGKCESCKKRARTDILVRLYHTFLYFKDYGGSALYVTYTYNDDNIPYFEYDGKHYNTFDKRHIQSYLKRLRITLSRKFNISTGLQYFFASEYGGITHRPHYHALLFIPKTDQLNQIKSYVSLLWTHGFTKFGNINNGIVNGFGALQYCSKYITKNVLSDVYFRYLKKILPASQYEKSKPFTLYSKKLGLIGLYHETKLNLQNGFCKIPSHHGFTLVRSPRYYDLKLFYKPTLNKNGNIQYVLRDDCKDIMYKRTSLYHDVIYNNIKIFLSTNFIDVHNLNKIHKYETFNTFTDFKSAWLEYINYDIDKFIDYLIFLDGYHDILVTDYDFSISYEDTLKSRFSSAPNKNLSYLSNHVPYTYILASHMLRSFNYVFNSKLNENAKEIDILQEKIKYIYYDFYNK